MITVHTIYENDFAVSFHSILETSEKTPSQANTFGIETTTSSNSTTEGRGGEDLGVFCQEECLFARSVGFIVQRHQVLLHDLICRKEDRTNTEPPQTPGDGTNKEGTINTLSMTHPRHKRIRMDALLGGLDRRLAVHLSTDPGHCHIHDGLQRLDRSCGGSWSDDGSGFLEGHDPGPDDIHGRCEVPRQES